MQQILVGAFERKSSQLQLQVEPLKGLNLENLFLPESKIGGFWIETIKNYNPKFLFFELVKKITCA